MILVDSAVCAAMKRDVKSSGYLAFGMVLSDEEWLGLKGDGWIVLAERENMPRKVLAQLVEHAGGIPGTGRAWSIQKPKKGEVQSQNVMFVMIEQEIQGLVDVKWDAMAQLGRMPLTLDGYGLWQDRETLKIRQLAPELEQLGVWMGKAVGNGGYICKIGLVSMCFVLREPEGEGRSVWMKHLEQMSWVM